MKKRSNKRKIWPFIVVPVVVLALLSGGIWIYSSYAKNRIEILKESIVFYESRREPYIEFIRSAQLDNGAYAMRPMYNGSAAVNPYFACYAAKALLACGGYEDEVKRYLDWHFANLNILADVENLKYTIYDFAVITSESAAPDKPTQEMIAQFDYDSADSYAALFLSVLKDYLDATGDIGYIRAQTHQIHGITEVIFSTLTEGLTYAKPSYEVAYLMDNSEVYEGLVCAQALLTQIGSDAGSDELLSRVNALTETLSQSIEDYFWYPGERRYEHSLFFRDGWKADSFDATKFYPDATSQLFPVFTGVIDYSDMRAQRLYETFCDNFAWQRLEHIANGDDRNYWGVIAYTSALLGDTTRLNSYLDNVENQHNYETYETQSTGNTLYNADAAFISMACTHMAQSAATEIERLDPLNILR